MWFVVSDPEFMPQREKTNVTETSREVSLAHALLAPRSKRAARGFGEFLTAAFSDARNYEEPFGVNQTAAGKATKGTQHKRRRRTATTSQMTDFVAAKTTVSTVHRDPSAR